MDEFSLNQASLQRPACASALSAGIAQLPTLAAGCCVGLLPCCVQAPPHSQGTRRVVESLRLIVLRCVGQEAECASRNTSVLSHAVSQGGR